MRNWQKYNWFWHGVKDNYPLCCIFFFMNVWQIDFDKDIILNWTSCKDGYIPCPNCLVEIMEIYNGDIK